MYTKVSELSAFVLDLNAQAQNREVASLVTWAVANLAEILGFDCAWFGWAQVQTSGTIIHANLTYNLPDNYYQVWTGMADQDVLVDQIIENPTGVATYDRNGSSQTDGMQFLADRFGINRMATAMCLRNERTASFYISAYRSGRNARPWSQSDREFLQCAVDNISAAARVSGQHELQTHDESSASILLSHHGATILGYGRLKERFGHLWSRADGDKVPRWLADYVDQPGEHMLPDQQLVATCEPVTALNGLAWHKLSLRPMRKFDLLTTREREVAKLLAHGHSHKEVAKHLGVAPSTVRNQTQFIYRKLGVDNRASLALHVQPPI